MLHVRLRERVAGACGGLADEGKLIGTAFAAVLHGGAPLVTLYDIVLTNTGAIKAYIVSVGGFLGIETRHVAVYPKAVTLNRQDQKNWKAGLPPVWMTPA